MSAQTKLRSNGFGRVEQQIVFSVPEKQAASLPDDLDITLLHEHTSPPRVSFLWRRWTLRRNNDEDIVAELFQTLGAPSDDLDWEIDWQASFY